MEHRLVDYSVNPKYTSIDSLSPSIRSNFPAKIAFRINLANESRLVIGNNQATILLPKGDILFSENGSIVRCQVAKCDTSDIVPLIDEIGKFVFPGYPYILPEKIIDFTPVVFEIDPLFVEAANFIVTSNIASTSSLQRRFMIGYNRAGKIMDQLESKGIVSGASGSKPRQVLVNLKQLNSIIAKL